MKNQYQSPTLTVVKFQVERGFVLSEDKFKMSFLHDHNDNYEVKGNEASSYTNEHWQW